MPVMAIPERNILFAVVLTLTAYASVFAQFSGGPLVPKEIKPGDRCPVSTGSHPTGLRSSSVFCADCLWFGSGPAYFAWAFQLGHGNDAVFNLTDVRHGRSGYSAKTPWVAAPDYSGPISIGGHRLDGKGTLRFGVNGSKEEKRITLTAANHAAADQWSFWPANMVIPHPGCYVIDIETTRGKDWVIFQAAESNAR
jgi:hypothetical protein